MDFHKIYFSVFRKSVEKIQVSLKYDMNNDELFLDWETFQPKICLETTKTRILC